MQKQFFMMAIGCLLLTIGAVAGGNDPGNCRKHNNEGPKPIEEFFLLVPGTEKDEHCKEVKKAVIDFYKWYLRNESKINSLEKMEGTGKEVKLPFNIRWRELKEYIQYIRKTVPGIEENAMMNEKVVSLLLFQMQRLKTISKEADFFVFSDNKQLSIQQPKSAEMIALAK